jgi:hypothetical protein
VVEPERSQMTIRRLRIACWITKATNTHSDCVILIAFPLQQWLHERASMLTYTYIACLIFISRNTSVWLMILKFSMLQECRALNKLQTVAAVSSYHVQRVNI